MQETAAALGKAAGLGEGAGPGQGGADVGACFQLALLAAGQGNDKEAGDYLRELIVALKRRVGKAGSDAGAG